MATRHAAAPEDGDSALIMDIDLAILGASQERFEQYEAGIRVEYAWVPAANYRAKRAELLDGFRARTNLFTTQMFRDRLELRARKTLLEALNGCGAKIKVEAVGAGA